jgi:FtsP/CotA-like multicopper oxidase with cupredoxin domain
MALAASLLPAAEHAPPRTTGAVVDVRASRVASNDNRRPAGRLAGDTLTLELRAGTGRWQPEGPGGPSLEVEALGEVGRPLSVPGPLIRVVAGTTIVASIRNELAAVLTVRGLCARDGTPCPPLEVPPGHTREVRFASGRPGTYHYWATTMGAPVPFRELAGAFVVDPAAGAIEPDRVLVITEWSSLTPDELRRIMGADDPSEAFVALRPRLTFVVNGLSWPVTERLTYQLGERVRWRLVNVSSQAHPMHLHGFYFSVDSLGDGLRDEVFDPGRRRSVVTQLVPPGGTMTMTWTPAREGNWLFHCHVMHHVSPERRLTEPAGASGGHAGGAHAHAHRHDDGGAGMAGMIVGVTVVPGAAVPGSRGGFDGSAPRRLTLAMRRAPAGRNGGGEAAGFVLREGGVPAASAEVRVPGPALVLRQDEPVEITLLNELPDPTAIHWHGLELDSYYDGVHGWSGIGTRRTPMIAPGGSFVVRLTPPRAGTFIYHTHLHDYRQLSSGLYGPLIVTAPDETFDPATDHVIVLGRSQVTAEQAILGEADSVVVNGERGPRFVWRAGARHRLRVVNITPDDIFVVALQTAEGPATWTPLRKDGAPLPPAETVEGPARQIVAVGETYDFEYQAPRGRARAWLEVRTKSGKWQAQGSVVIR